MRQATAIWSDGGNRWVHLCDIHDAFGPAATAMRDKFGWTAPAGWLDSHAIPLGPESKDCEHPYHEEGTY